MKERRMKERTLVKSRNRGQRKQKKQEIKKGNRKKETEKGKRNQEMEKEKKV